MVVVTKSANLGILYEEVGNLKSLMDFVYITIWRKLRYSKPDVYPADTRLLRWRLSVFVKITQVDWLRGYRQSETSTPAGRLSCQLVWRVSEDGLGLSISCM